MSDLTRKEFLQLTGATGASLTLPSTLSEVMTSKTSASSDAPNILLMITDDSSPFSFSAYGNEVNRTPHLNRLASEGMVFNRGYCSSPQCSPARASILTGRVPHDVYASRLHQAVPDRVLNMISILNGNGYYTGAFGKTHQPNIQEDFQFYADYKNYYKKPKNGKSFTSFFDEKPDDKPFFLWFGSWNPHRRYNRKTIKYIHKYDPSEVEVPEFLPDTPEVRQDIAYYYDKLFQFDQNCGKLMSILDERGLTENTMVIQTSDHGMPFPRAKATLYEPGIRVPLVIKWPGVVSPGSSTGALVSTMDLTATWMEMAGIEVPDLMQSRSFLSVLSGKKNHVRDYVYAERNWHDNWDPMRCVVGKRYKLIQRYRPEVPYIPELDRIEGLSYESISRLIEQGTLPSRLSWYGEYRKSPRPEIEFYDLKDDPGEWKNLTDGPYQKKNEKKRVFQYQVKLSHWMSQTNDFLPPPRTAYPGGPTHGYNRKYDPLYALPYEYHYHR